MKALLPQLSKALSERLKRTVVVVHAKRAGAGFESEGFTLTTRDGEVFFLKRTTIAKGKGHLFERYLFSHLTSHHMGKRSGKTHAHVGVAVGNARDFVLIPEDISASYHLQEFETFKGKNYRERLLSRKNRCVVTTEEKEEIDAVVRLLLQIHGGALLHDERVKKDLYNDGLQAILAYPGMFFMFLHDFGKKHPVFPERAHDVYVGSMIKLLHAWKDRFDRLRTLHGDFWGSNVYFKEDKSACVVDYSRIPYGDPGIDVASWLAQYLWLYHETKNVYFKECGTYFLERYVRETKDRDIRKAVALPLGLLGVIYISPRLYPDLDKKTARRFFAVIRKILAKGVFSWE